VITHDDGVTTGAWFACWYGHYEQTCHSEQGDNGQATDTIWAGVVDPGRTGARSRSTSRNGDNNGSGNSTPSTTSSRQPAPRNNPPSRDWWPPDIGDASRISERDRKRMSSTAHSMGENFHAMGDFLYRPDLAPDADRPVGKPSKRPQREAVSVPTEGERQGNQASGEVHQEGGTVTPGVASEVTRDQFVAGMGAEQAHDVDAALGRGCGVACYRDDFGGTTKIIVTYAAGRHVEADLSGLPPSGYCGRSLQTFISPHRSPATTRSPLMDWEQPRQVAAPPRGQSQTLYPDTRFETRSSRHPRGDSEYLHLRLERDRREAQPVPQPEEPLSEGARFWRDRLR
jgi:hypothetical protein